MQIIAREAWLVLLEEVLLVARMKLIRFRAAKLSTLGIAHRVALRLIRSDLVPCGHRTQTVAID